MIEVTEKTFEAEVLNSTTPVVVDFWAEWCGPCKSLGPILNSISQQRSDVKIVKVNVDDNSDLAVQFRIQSIPTMIFFNGGNIKDVKIGFSSEKDVNDWISSNL